MSPEARPSKRIELENYARDARNALDSASEYARRTGFTHYAPEHILLAFALQNNPILEKLSIEPESVRKAIDKISGRGKGPLHKSFKPQPALSTREVLSQAERLAKKDPDSTIQASHILESIVKYGAGNTRKIINELGISEDVIAAFSWEQGLAQWELAGPQALDRLKEMMQGNLDLQVRRVIAAGIMDTLTRAQTLLDSKKQAE